jgi:hypothetical protein
MPSLRTTTERYHHCGLSPIASVQLDPSQRIFDVVGIQDANRTRRDHRSQRRQKASVLGVMAIHTDRSFLIVSEASCVAMQITAPITIAMQSKTHNLRA